MKEKETKFTLQEVFKDEDINERKETIEKIILKIIKDEELNTKA